MDSLDTGRYLAEVESTDQQKKFKGASTAFLAIMFFFYCAYAAVSIIKNKKTQYGTQVSIFGN